MGIREIERQIMQELRIVAKNPKLKLRQLMEWSTAPIEGHEGESMFFLDKLGIYCAVKNEIGEHGA